jgi:hypothetical protein
MKIADVDVTLHQNLPTIKNVRIYRTKKRKLPEYVENQHKHHTLHVIGGKATYDIPPGECREFEFGTDRYSMSWVKAKSTGNSYLDSLKDNNNA